MDTDAHEWESDLTEVVIGAIFELSNPFGQVFVGGKHFPQSNEGADNCDAHLHRALASQHGGEHHHPVLSESIWPVSLSTPNLRSQFAISRLQLPYL
jgi:hypothetical protein